SALLWLPDEQIGTRAEPTCAVFLIALKRPRRVGHAWCRSSSGLSNWIVDPVHWSDGCGASSLKLDLRRSNPAQRTEIPSWDSLPQNWLGGFRGTGWRTP